MNETALLIESLRLLGIGMGIVFSFLLLLVGLLRLMSALILRLAPEEAPAFAEAPGLPSERLAEPPRAAEPDDLAAVIAAAVAHYRRRR